MGDETTVTQPEAGNDRLANIVGALALALADEVGAATVEASGHTRAGPAALVALHDLLDGRSVDDLRNAVNLTHSGGVRLVDRLVDDGLAARRRGVDGRTVALVLTARGRRLAQQARDARRDALTELLDVLDARERSQLTSIAEKLIGAVVDQRLDARAVGDVPAGGWLCRLCDPAACGRPDGECPAANAATARAR